MKDHVTRPEWTTVITILERIESKLESHDRRFARSSRLETRSLRFTRGSIASTRACVTKAVLDTKASKQDVEELRAEIRKLG